MTDEKYGKLNRRSNNTAHYARKKRTMITRRENFGGTAPSHFLWQATVVKIPEDHANVTSQQSVPSTLSSLRDSIFQIFYPMSKNISLPSGAHPLEFPVLPHLKA